MKFLLHIVVLLLALPVHAQDTTRFVCSFPEMAQFPGGEEAYRQYLKDNVRYPANEKAQGIDGVVYVYFEVSETGKIEHARIQRGIEHGDGLNAEALRVIAAMPDWKPSMVNGKPQKTAMTQPIRFTLDTAASATPTYATSPAPRTASFAFIAPSVDYETMQPPVCTTDTLHNDTIPAELPGGSMEQWKFIGANVRYPTRAKELCHQGDVIVFYDVDSVGSITNVRVHKGVEGAPELNEEALRVVKLFPKHTPATCKGTPVKFTLAVVVRYKLQ